jgi:alpha-ribazole phosphatase
MLLTLIRHGEVEGRSWVFRGHSDPPLSDAGWETLRACAEKLPCNFSRIISSDLCRCRAFAEKWSRDIDVPLHIERRLREIDFGAWEELTPEEVQSRFPKAFAEFRVAPESWAGAGGESFAEFRERVVNALDELHLSEPTAHFAIVTHAGVIRLILSMVLRVNYLSALQLDVGYASAREVCYEPTLPSRIDAITKIT